MGATVPAQARALLARSAIYQRRNTATNVCLVVAPIFFCVLLAVLQLLANNLILTQRDNKCGCQCLECCIPRRVQRPWTAREQQLIDSGVQLTPRFDRIEDCSALDTGYCERVRNATCRSYNDSSCSLRFSSPWQAVWCPIPQPSSWPPVMPMGRRANRAGGTLRQWMPFTGANMTAAREVAAGMFNLPELPSVQGLIEMFQTTPLSVLNLPPSKLLGLLLPALSPGVLVRDGGEAVDGALLSRLGLRFGSSLRPNTDYYLENAFINSNSNQSQLHVLMPEGGCIAAGLGNVTTSVSMPLVEMLLRVYNATYPALLQPLLAALNVTADTEETF
ncbi:hypothetical protein HYH03_004514 [Edaphochlamys debaryana]|uniref:Uncharacterized protein n=1 Tax=Edaphochlamys debaryana TaxID=47281 RepID=A0A835Y6X5_9CHLO|nr:hypothetical protein HYH03_004514 [Edaphochlamys debaryana]|eukprot:KAG2497355.1 hypothetical protein HYH03_004514 [Edaphochlamys debaryana]